MADRIKGITVQIGGDTTGLSKALSGVNKQIKNTQSQLKDVEKLLKLDPTNTKLLEQKQRLLSGAVEETKTKLDSLKNAEKEVQQQFKDGIISQSQMDAFNREMVEAQQVFDAAKEKAKEFGGVVAQEMQIAGQKVSDMGEKISDAGDKISGAGKKLAPVTVAITGAGAASTVLASDFETSMAKLATIADTSKLSTDAMRAQILEVSNQYGISAGDIAEATYSAISAGQDTEKAVQFVADSMQLAKAGFTDSATSIDTLTTIMNAYGDASGSAADISNRLIVAQNLGKTTVAELGSSMGKVIPTAAMYGVNLDNLASAYVTTTKNGIATAESTTYINGMLNELGKSGSTVSDTLKKKTGKSFKELMNDGQSLSDVLAIVQQAAEDSGKSMADMFSSQEAAKAAATITQHADDFTSAMDAMAESGGKTAEAFATVDNTTEAAKEKLITSAQNVAITFGDMLIPVIKDIIGYAQQIVDWLNSLDEGQKQTIIQVLAVVAALSPALLVFGKVVTVTGNIVSGVGMVIKIAGSLVGFVTGTAVPGITSALTTLFAFLAANPVIAIILAITAAIIALVALVGTKGDEIQALLQKVDDFLQAVFATDWTNVFGPVLGTALNLFFANVKNVWDHVKQVLDGIIDFIRGVFTGDWERAWTGVKEIFAGIFDGLKAAAKAPLNAIIRLVNAAISGINGVIHTVNKLPGVNIGEIGQIPYLAKGGILSRGSAVVGEAGPELLTINQGRAVVQPLTNNNTTNNANYGGVTVNVYAAAGQDVNELAEAVVYKIQHAVDQTGAVWE